MNQGQGITKVELLLEGLDCANCAMKIENGVKKVEGVASCAVNVMTKTLTIETAANRSEETVAEAIRTVNRIERHIAVSVKGKPAGRGAASEHQDEHRDVKDEHKPHSHEHGLNKKLIIRLAAGALLTGIGMTAPLSGWPELGLYLAAYLLIGGDVVLRAVKNIIRGQVFDEYFLMSVATIGAFAIGQYPEGVAVMLFYQLGELLQGMAVNRSRKSISSLMNIRPDYANLKTGTETRRVPPEAVSIGDYIVVRPGEKVPLDGEVVEGSSMIDTSALTGRIGAAGS